MVSLIFHEIRLIFSLTLILFLSACASNELRYDGYSPINKVFNDEFEVVWRASQIALQKYPMKINNIDKGELETDWIKGYEFWNPPYETPIKERGMQYKLSLKTVKGRIKKEPAIKVSLQKIIEKKRDFFAETEKLPSDSLEEKSILYRIEREIQIDRALQLAQEKENK
jgi:hypothetical protein